MSDRSIHVYFDYRSPFAYIAAEVLPELAERHGAELRWNPIDLMGLSNFSGGLPYSEKKRAYVFVDAARSAEFHGVAIRPPSPFPVEPELALRVALVAERHGRFEPVHRALFRAAWCEELDLSSEGILARCIRDAGGDPEAWLAEARTPATEKALRLRTEEAEAAGVFGVPTMALAGELFWGVDSLPVLEWRLGRSSPGRSSPGR